MLTSPVIDNLQNHKHYISGVQAHPVIFTEPLAVVGALTFWYGVTDRLCNSPLGWNIIFDLLSLLTFYIYTGQA